MRKPFETLTQKLYSSQWAHIARLSLQQSNEIIFWTKENGGFEYANPKAISALGYTLPEFYDLSIKDVLANWRDDQRAFRPVPDQPSTPVVQSILRRKNGSTFSVDLINRAIKIDGKKLNCATCREISRPEEGSFLPRQRGESQSPVKANTLKGPSSNNAIQIIGTSRLHQNTLNESRKAAQSDASVLITGESGSGKERVAQFIHGASKRSHRKMISLNCAALTNNDIISRLFGHVTGAYTGANKTRNGVFSLADKSTLFLDEIGELTLDIQAKLLRVLQEGTFTKMGGEKVESSDVRIIAATNRKLTKMVRAGAFRKDLYYRLAIFEVTVHPLRNRQVDIIPLVKHRLAHLNRKYQMNKMLPPNTELKPLLALPLPGNVRELFALVERAFHYSAGDVLHFPQTLIMKFSHIEDTPSELDFTNTRSGTGRPYSQSLRSLQLENQRPKWSRCHPWAKPFDFAQ